MALGQQEDDGRACVLGGGGKEHWDPHRKWGWQDGPQSQGGIARGPLREIKTRYVALSRQISRIETLANK